MSPGKEASVSGTGLCPFSWIEVAEKPGCLLASLFGAKEKIVWTPQSCMKSQCKLWDAAESDCGLVTKKESKTEYTGVQVTKTEGENICPKCGSKLPTRAKFCTSCGSKLN